MDIFKYTAKKIRKLDVYGTTLSYLIVNKRWKISKDQSKMDNPKKLATQGTQDEEKQSKNTHNMC